ncbi:serine kinase [soil metagenome]
MDSPSKYFDVAYAAFCAEEQTSEEAATFSIQIANNFTVQIRLANEKLVSRFRPAVQNLVCEAVSVPDLSICIWESPAPGFSPQLRWGEPFVQMWTGSASKVYCNPGEGRLMAADWQRNVGLFWMKSFENLMWWEDARPLIDILHWWLLSRKTYFIHSAAVGTAHGAALLVGAGGSGKSTTALTCLEAGLLYAGDDFCLVDRYQGVPRVFGTYSSAKLHPWSLEKLPGLHAMVSPLPCINDGDDSKQMLFFDESYSKLLAREMPIRVILLPKVGHCETSFLTPVSHNTVLKALIPSTKEILKGCDVTDFYGVFALTKGIPSYQLTLGTDQAQLIDVIEQSIKKAGAKEQTPVFGKER